MTRFLSLWNRHTLPANLAESRTGPGLGTASRRLARPQLELLEDRLAPAIVTVTTLSDAPSHRGTSLRDAIAAANPGDTIQFQGGLNGTIDLSTSEGGRGGLTLSQNVTIDGTGAAITVAGGNSVGNANNAEPFTVNSGVSATLDSLTISNGWATFGGGIFNQGTLLLNRDTVSGNTATNNGGGIFNTGVMTIFSSTISNNSATYNGGFCEFGTQTLIVNSTVAGNTASQNGGGIGNSGPLTVINCTISNNEAPLYASGIDCRSTTSVQNTIIAGNIGAPDFAETDGGALTDNGHNLVTGATLKWTGPGDILKFNGKGSFGLGSLGDNGGPTQTMALLPGSPAIDAGNNALAVDAQGNPLTTDQSGPGFPRIVNGTVDIGAFEFRPAYLVTTTADSGPGSLRDAITQIDADTNHTLYAGHNNPGVDEIDFNITADSDTGGGYNPTTGVATITPLSALPTIANAVIIDGYTQTGASGNTNAFGQADNAILKIELSGASAGNVNGLTITAPNTTVRGLVINRFSNFTDAGIHVVGSACAGTQIDGNFIGVDPTGTIDEGNFYGVYVDSVALTGTNHVTIGSNGDGVDDLRERNVIAGVSPQDGSDSIRIRIQNSSNVVVEGNYLGTDATGTKAIDNVQTGAGGNIYLYGIVSNVLVAGNVSSGAGAGFLSQGNISNITFLGNRIGTTADGTAALANAYGIYMTVDANSNPRNTIQNITIGGLDTNTPGAPLTGAGNLISGNLYSGVSSYGADNLTIQGNYIGTDVTGSYAIPNQGTGVVIAAAAGSTVPGSNNVLIGGVTAGLRNVISGNQQNGIYFELTGSNIQVQGNYIGTNATGDSVTGTDGNPVGNGTGIWLAGANGIIVGGPSSAARNVISGNGGNDGAGIYAANSNNVTIQGNYLGTDVTGASAFTFTHSNDGNIKAANDANLNVLGNVISGGAYFGILLYPNVNGVTIQGNRIGTNAAGTAALGNGFGIYMTENIQNVTIGGTGTAAGNVISGNLYNGVTVASPDCSNVTVQGNFVGTDVNGNIAIPNGANGIASAGSYIQIGGTILDANGKNVSGNLISGNLGDGIAINNPSSAKSTLIQGNKIGIDISGSHAVGNCNGVEIGFGGGFNTTVGGTIPAARNVISGNQQSGVAIYSGAGSVLEGNYIGTDSTGTSALPNVVSGVNVNGANNVIIGGASTTARNVISGNDGHGIYLTFTTGDVIQNNYIGTDATGSTALGNAGYGIIGYGANIVSLGGVGMGNVISGNGAGVIDSQGSGWLVQGNRIGTNANATSALGNADDSLRFGGPNAANNIIGGTVLGAGNTVAGNSHDGITLSDGTHNNFVEGNYIGVNAGGDNIGNGRNGVVLYAGANNNQIGGVVSNKQIGDDGPGNHIAYNGLVGVSIGVSYDTNVGVVGNSILGNSVYSNLGGGIVLATAAANDNQPAPVLTSVVGGSSPTITGILATKASTTYRIEFFASAAPISLSNSAGRTLLGSVLVIGDGTTKSFTASGLSPAPVGQNYFTATATVAISAGASYTYGDTSAFSSYLVRRVLAVKNTADSGADSLRDAVSRADSDAVLGLSDLINFDASLAGQTIALATALPHLSGSGWITIDGSGLSSPVRVQNNTSRVFEVDSGLCTELDSLVVTSQVALGNSGGGISNAGTLTINGCTVSGGANNFGGGIYNNGMVTVDSCTFSNNRATGTSSSEGGGIFNNGTLTITNSTLSSNGASGGTGTVGGAIFNGGTLFIDGCTISSNSAAAGGGIWNDHATITIKGTTISHNSGQSNGGGIYNAGTLTVSNSALVGNVVGGDGGGIYNNGSLTVNNGSALTANTSRSGGGLYSDTPATLTVDSSTIAGNSASAVGGGICSKGNGSVTNSSVSGNSSSGLGGGVSNYGTLTLSADAVFANTSGSSGGGVHTSGKVILDGCTVANNQAKTSDGGIFRFSSGTVSIQGQNQSAIYGNLAPSNADISSILIGAPLSTAYVTGLTASVNSTGQIIYTVQVAPTAKNAAIPTGTVKLYDANNAQIGSPTGYSLSGGSATISEPAILGSRSPIHVVYGASKSAPLIPVVNALSLNNLPFFVQKLASVSVPTAGVALDASTTDDARAAAIAISRLKAPSLHTALAAAGSTSTSIKLDSGAAVFKDYYLGARISIIAGTGINQTRTITAYDGSTKIATVDKAWSVTPDATSRFEIDAPVTVVLRLQGIYGDLAFRTQPGVKLVVTGSSGTKVIGNSPAVEIDGGEVELSDLDLTTDTDAPALLITGGEVTVRDCTIEGSTAYSDPAIAVSGDSIVDLGTPENPGGNTITVTGTAPPIESAGTNVILATGDTIQANGATISVVANVALDSSANPSLLNQSVTFTATVSAPDASSAAPTGNVTFLDQTSGNTLAVVPLSAGVAKWTGSGLVVNAHTIAAIYSGDSNYITSAATQAQQVDYRFSGFATPLSSNLAFGLNRTIPIKFQLTDYTGASISDPNAVQSLHVLDASGNNVFANAGSTSLRYDATTQQFIANWSTKGLPAGAYVVTLVLADGMTYVKTVQLSANGSNAALLVDGSSPATTAVGALLGGDIELYVDNSNSDLTDDELARIHDAIAIADAVTEPYGVKVEEVSDPTLADITLNMDSTSAVGGYADGVLGCTTDSGQITIIQGWDYYAGSDASQIGSAQFDFETVVTHELGHALGVGHSADSASVMYATLNTGTSNRSLTTADLNVADSGDDGACGLHAAAEVIAANSSTQVVLSRNVSTRGTMRDATHEMLFALLGAKPTEFSVVSSRAVAGIPDRTLARWTNDAISSDGNDVAQCGTQFAPTQVETARYGMVERRSKDKMLSVIPSRVDGLTLVTSAADLFGDVPLEV